MDAFAYFEHVKRQPSRGEVSKYHPHDHLFAYISTFALIVNANVLIDQHCRCTIESRYNVPRLQRIRRYNVFLPRSRFHVREYSRIQLTIVTTYFLLTPLGVRCNATRLHLTERRRFY